MRGKETGAGKDIAEDRITPARAGKRSDSQTSAKIEEDHPRACGEKEYAVCLARRNPGSPPRVRGKGHRERHSPAEAGITPARAGKSETPVAIPGAVRDHPRACGEKPTVNHADVVRWGSPPRVRGKGVAASTLSGFVGITPARAGKRPSCPGSRRWPGDHPRACGEKRLDFQETSGLSGSPPRVRGKVLSFRGQWYSSRITPARAGKSRIWRDTGRDGRDHPRACGEKEFPEALINTAEGSPPRVRGKD